MIQPGSLVRLKEDRLWYKSSVQSENPDEWDTQGSHTEPYHRGDTFIVYSVNEVSYSVKHLKTGNCIRGVGIRPNLWEEI